MKPYMVLGFAAFVTGCTFFDGAERDAPDASGPDISEAAVSGAGELVAADQCSADQSGFADIAGEYDVIGLRMASHVASIAPPEISAEDSPIGQSVVIDGSGVQISGMGCDCWSAVSEPVPGDMPTDRMLKDLHLPALAAEASTGDARLSRAYSLSCEGEHFALAYQTGPRVMALTWMNSSAYLVLEKPLTGPEVEAFQRELKAMKFYEGEITGVLDEATASSARAYYIYRLRDDEAAIPQRIAITANLLDGLNVLVD